MRRVGMEEIRNPKLPLTSSFITVGPSGCQFSSLTEATKNSPEGSKFYIFPSTYDGKIHLKKDCSFHLIGRVIFKQSSNDYLFQIVPPSTYNEGDPTPSMECYFYGAQPFLDPFDSDHWFQNPMNDNTPYLSLMCYVMLHGLYYQRNFWAKQNSTNDPVIYDDLFTGFKFERNFNINKLSSSPSYSRTDTGKYRIQLAPDSFEFISFRFYILNILPIQYNNRNFLWAQNYMDNYLDLEVQDETGTYTDDWSALFNLSIPFSLIFEQ